MSDIKPVSSYEPVYRCKVLETLSWLYFENEPKRQFAVVETLYPAAAYEALQKENEFLSEENKTLKLCIESDELSYKIIAEWNEAQAKRIAELEEQNLDYWNQLVKVAASKNGDSK